MMDYPGNLFVVAAPSGAGKSSLVKALMELDSHVQPSVSHTTRPPRGQEKHGREYYFVPAEEFDRMVMFRHAQPLQQILEFVRQSKAKQITITGQRAASVLSNGERMLEQETMGQHRAEQIAELLKGAGLDDVNYELKWKDVTRAADGTNDASLRKVEVTVR